MTLEEAIKREEEQIEHYYTLVDYFHTDEGVYLREETRARDNAEYHEQLAEWLKQFKQIKKLTDLYETTMEWGCNDEAKALFANAIYACIYPEKKWFQECIDEFKNYLLEK